MRTGYDGGIDGDIEHLMDAVADACATENDEIISLYDTLRRERSRMGHMLDDELNARARRVGRWGACEPDPS
jgi:hypothetical protein